VWLQGDCDPVAVLPGTNNTDPQPLLRPRQCFLLTAGKFFYWRGDTPNIWIDNLYIRVHPRAVWSDVVLMDWRPTVEGKLWATFVTLEGDGSPPKASLVMGRGGNSCKGFEGQNAPAYFGGTPPATPPLVAPLVLRWWPPTTGACAFSSECEAVCSSSHRHMAVLPRLAH
jgi:hypothetical protein